MTLLALVNKGTSLHFQPTELEFLNPLAISLCKQTEYRF